MTRYDLFAVIATVVALALAAVVLVASMSGCAPRATPASASERIVERQVSPDGTERVIEHTSESTGAGFVGEGADTYKSGGVTAGLRDGATAGAGSLDMFRMEAPANPILIAIGAAAILLGAVGGYYLRSVGLGLLLAGAGASLIALAIYPWLLLVGAGLVAIGAGWLAYDLYRNRRRGETLAAIVPGIESLSGGMAQAVKDAVARFAGKNRDAVKAEVSRTKKATGSTGPP